MAFHDDVRFPDDIAYGSTGGPKFSTTILGLASGYEQRNINWEEVRAEFNVGHGIKSRAQMDAVIAFFYAQEGRAHGFRFKDWADFTIATQQIGVGNGVQTAFQVVKTYTVGATTFRRPLRKLVAGTVAGITVNGSPSTNSVNVNTGVITFTSAPAIGHVVAVGAAEFDVPVRFDTDHLNITHDFWETMSWPDIPLVEVRL